MRQILSMLIIAALLVCAVVPVHAATSSYYLPDLQLSVDIPTEYDVFTLDMDANDPLFSEYGTTKSELNSQLSAKNIYLNAVDPDGKEEVIVTMAENVISDFDGLSDTVLLTMASAVEDEYQKYGVEVSEYDIFRHSQVAFVRLYFHDSANSAYGLQYYTVYNNQSVNLTLRSYSGPISSAQEATMKSIVDSVRIDNYSPQKTSSESTAAFVHKDKDTGASFTVPANWKQESLSKDREYIDVKFASTEESGLLIMYGSTDLWSMLSASERAGYTRSDVDNSIFTNSDVAEMFGTLGTVTTKTYNGKEYFFAEVTTTSDTYGVNLSVTMTHVLRVENGWAYWFQFGGKSTSPYFDDFEQLIRSTNYPDYVKTDTDNIGGIVVGILIIVGGIIVTVVLISRKRQAERTKYQNTFYAEQVAQPPSPAEPQPTPKNDYRYCHICGSQLPNDSSFCHKCGVKIPEV